MSRQNGPRSHPGFKNPPKSAEVTHALGDIQKLLGGIREDYKDLESAAYSGRVYPETEPVSSGHGHTDPTGEAAMDVRSEDNDAENARGAMRDDLRYAARMVDKALRTLENAETALGRGIRRGDFRHHVYQTPVDFKEQISPAERQELQNRVKERREAL